MSGLSPARLAILRELASRDGQWLQPSLVADAVTGALDEIHVAQMRGDELARELDAAQTCISELQRELAAARTYIRELERENAGSFW